jgi:hypothetical protein
MHRGRGTASASRCDGGGRFAYGLSLGQRLVTGRAHRQRRRRTSVVGYIRLEVELGRIYMRQWRSCSGRSVLTPYDQLILGSTLLEEN